jgi:hypothetical protein
MEGLAFYSAAAGVIPVLLIVVAIERRFFVIESLSDFLDRTRDEPWFSSRRLRILKTVRHAAWTLYLIGLVWVVVIGEVVALNVLDKGKASDWEHDFVWLAITLEVVWIMIAALTTPASRHRSLSKPQPSGDQHDARSRG